MEKNTRIKSAEETLEILNQGYYIIHGNKIDISTNVQRSIDQSKLWRPHDFDAIAGEVENTLAEVKYSTEIEVSHCTVLEATQFWSEKYERVGCLNFASAKNPGGGFLNGAQAQEESLARASGLYPTLVKNNEMYTYNKNQHTYLYADYMIYSPEVVFIKNDQDGLLTQPYTTAVLTSPAVNVGAIKTNKPAEMDLVEQTMQTRIEKLLSLFVYYQREHIILGAWGCGVFKNDAAQVAKWFYEALGKHGKFARAFKTIVFAIHDRSKEGNILHAFQQQFSSYEKI
jgi:uncharacterized protein (TIGR02452 family)